MRGYFFVVAASFVLCYDTADEERLTIFFTGVVLVNTLVQIKKIVVLVFVLTIVPLCAMDNRLNRRSPRLIEKADKTKKQYAFEKKLEADLVARGKINEKKRRAQTELAYDNPTAQPLRKRAKAEDTDLITTVLQPMDADKFIEMIEIDRTCSTPLNAPILRPVIVQTFKDTLVQVRAEEFRKMMELRNAMGL